MLVWHIAFTNMEMGLGFKTETLGKISCLYWSNLSRALLKLNEMSNYGKMGQFVSYESMVLT